MQGGAESVRILQETYPIDYMPSLASLYPDGVTNIPTDGPEGVMPFEGGEDAALRRVQQWMFDGDNLREYFSIRNGMLGEAYSSKLSPWLAHGCISPRYVVSEVKRYEEERRIANKSTYWLIFELIWRDFFRFLCTKYGDQVFYPGGAHDVRKPWSKDPERIRRWITGTTGMPLVDANMRELLATGFMSNRGRQNVASFLCLDYKVDWRVGAHHFESLLLDHDVYSNYGNWNAAAGLTGGRVNKFNIGKQSRDYDNRGDYIRHWVPELRNVPAPQIFEPWQMSVKDQERYGCMVGTDYPMPLKLPNDDFDSRGGGGRGGGSSKGKGGKAYANQKNGGGGKFSRRDSNRGDIRAYMLPETAADMEASPSVSVPLKQARRGHKVQHL
jgi:deoxyribodipyrimidine photo-lyase